MEGYGYPYPQYPGARPGPSYPDHGDGYGDHFGPPMIMGPPMIIDRSRAKHRTRNDKRGKRSRSASGSKSRSRSRSKSGSRSRSRSKSRARSRSQSSRSNSGSRAKELVMREPSFLDAFRILYLSSSNSKKSTTKYLATKKRQDRIEEVLKSDGLGSKRWLFYPRSQNSEPVTGQVAGTRDNSDQRIKIDGQWFRKYKRSQSVDRDAPIAKLKRWELIFYKKLGFIRAV